MAESLSEYRKRADKAMSKIEKMLADMRQESFDLKEYQDDRKNHHLHFEIAIAWDDDDEFEHMGYYKSAEEAIKALEEYIEH